MLLSPRREVGEFRKRYKWMALVASIVFLGLIGRLTMLQLFEGDRWSAIANENITKTIPLAASRGIIRDSRGRVIATNRPSYDVYITPAMFEPEQREHFIELLRLNEEEIERMDSRMERVPERRRMHQILTFRDISRDRLAALQTHRGDLDAIDVAPRPVRTYPYGHLGAHAIGYLNEVNAEDLERLGRGSGYRAGDVIGRMGIERNMEDNLRGDRGHRRILVDARGRRQRDPQHAAREETLAPTPGLDVVLSLDMELMQIIEGHFNHPSGSVVVVDVETGRIRALFSKPVYDLNELAAGMSHSAYGELRDNPFRPLIDKTIYESYFPGSIFKPFSALAALEEDLMTPSQRVECIGYYQIGTDRKRCTSSHGDVNIQSALSQSCNVYFYRLAEEVGLERLNRYARMFGLGQRTGIGINSEASGFLATREWYEERFGRFRVGDTLNVAIGQGNTRATLIQLALAYGALANGGRLYAPQLIESTRTASGELVEEIQPEVTREVDIRDDFMDLIHNGLLGAVNTQSGTAYEARIDGGVTIAGKTGTAEVAPGIRRRDDPRLAVHFNRSHAWFAGYAPAEDPEVAIVVLVEHGGSGGRAAAPIGVRVLQDYLGGR